MINRAKAAIFLKSIWNGISGIAAEISLVFFFIAAGFIVSIFWWSFIR